MPLMNRTSEEWKKILREAILGIPESEMNKPISKKIDELIELVKTKHIRTEALLSIVLEKESITQDKFDELVNMLKEFGRQKGFKVD